MKNKYNEKSFGHRISSLKSAKIIVPMVIDLVHPQSVIDVGCGNGAFLLVFKKNGIKNILGIESPFMEKETTLISKDYFLYKNLEKPVDINKNFNIAISLEVAEHLSKNSAATFIKTLTSLSPVVLFSAAIPLQCGFHHLNEQCPDYWAKLFAKRGYIPVDALRRKIWNNENVSFWYAQNTFFFIRKDYLKKYDKLRKEFEQMGSDTLTLIHPKQYFTRMRRYVFIERHFLLPIIWTFHKFSKGLTWILRKDLHNIKEANDG